MVSFAGQVLPPSPVLAPRDDAAQRLAGKASTSQRAPERREVAAEEEEDEDAAPRNDSEAVTSAKLLLAGDCAAGAADHSLPGAPPGAPAAANGARELVHAEYAGQQARRCVWARVCSPSGCAFPLFARGRAHLVIRADCRSSAGACQAGRVAAARYERKAGWHTQTDAERAKEGAVTSVRPPSALAVALRLGRRRSQGTAVVSRWQVAEPGQCCGIPVPLAAQVQGLERPPGALGARPVRMGLGAAFTQVTPRVRTGAVCQ